MAISSTAIRKSARRPPAAQIEGARRAAAEATDRSWDQRSAGATPAALAAAGPAGADQLEYGDYLIWKSRATIKNAPGFYVYLLRQNILAAGGLRNLQPDGDARAPTRSGRREESRRRILARRSISRVLPRQSPGASEDARRRGAQQRLLAEKMRTVRRQWGHLPAATIEELAQPATGKRSSRRSWTCRASTNSRRAARRNRYSTDCAENPTGRIGEVGRAVIGSSPAARRPGSSGIPRLCPPPHRRPNPDQERPRGGDLEIPQRAPHHPALRLAAAALSAAVCGQ